MQVVKTVLGQQIKTLPNTLTALFASCLSVVGSYRPRYLSLLDYSMTLNIGVDFRHVHYPPLM